MRANAKRTLGLLKRLLEITYYPWESDKVLRRTLLREQTSNTLIPDVAGKKNRNSGIMTMRFEAIVLFKLVHSLSARGLSYKFTAIVLIRLNTQAGFNISPWRRYTW